MALVDIPEIMEYKVLHLFSGLGGAAIGFQRAIVQYKGIKGKFRTLAGIDCDPAACKDFELLTGAPGVVMDLFTRDQYVAFHGHQPSVGWKEVVPEELRFVCNYEFPDAVFLSAPCKGFSSLLPKKAAESAKYQALNRLVLRGLRLVLQAFGEKLPKLLLFENVPRITKRGAGLLKEVKDLLSQHGYVFHEATHCCGEIGGLGQRRRRYLLIARHQEQLPCFIYQPPRQKLKAIGDVIGPLPFPGDPVMGPMHRLPKLQWKTWVRLSMIPAGGDWRDLEEFATKNEEARRQWEHEGVKTEGETHLFKGKLAVMPFDEPSRTVIGGNSNGACYVADTRLGYRPINGSWGVQDWYQPGATVIGSSRVNGSNAVCVADPRVASQKGFFGGAYGVMPFDEPSRMVTAGGNGAAFVADTRIPHKAGRHVTHFKVTPWEDPAGTITGATHIANGAPAVADRRLWDWKNKPGLMGVQDWYLPAQTITGSACVTSSNCPAAVADPRLKGRYRAGMYGILDWSLPSPTITGHAKVNGSNCPAAVADPRFKLNPNSPKFNHAYAINPWKHPSPTVTGGTGPSSGGICVADPRKKKENWSGSGFLEVMNWQSPSKTIVGSLDIHAGAAAVADPRLEEEKVKFSNKFQLLNWNRPATTVTGTPDIQSGAQSVADPRMPRDYERLENPPILIAADGTWHRPLTTLELAALQGLPLTLPDGKPLVLDGKSDAKWRERIGNAVPPASAENMAKEVLKAFLANAMGEWLMGNTEIWVKPIKGRYSWIFRYARAMTEKNGTLKIPTRKKARALNVA